MLAALASSALILWAAAVIVWALIRFARLLELHDDITRD